MENSLLSPLVVQPSPGDGKVLRLLLIEDSRVDACVIQEYLQCSDEVRVDLERADRLSAGLSRLREGCFHAALVDLNLPDSEGVDTVIRIHACAPRIPIVVLTGIEEKQGALQAVRAGAEDYLCKSDLEPKLLLRTVRYAIERAAHRQVDEQLREEETRYRRLLEAVTSYTYSVTFNGGVSSTRHGLGCLATTGYSPEEYAADCYLWIRIVHREDQATVRQYVARVLAGEKVPPIEHRILHKDGSTRWIRDTIIHRYDQGGRPSGYDGVVEDITQRKQAENKLAYLASFPEKNPHPIMELSLDGEIRYLNPAADRLFPGLREQGLAHPWLADWSAMVRQASGEPRKTAIRELVIGQRSYEQFCCYIAEDEVVRTYGLDITERKQAVESLRTSEESLREREAHLLAAQAIQTQLWPAAPPWLPGFDIAGAVYPTEFTAGDYFDYLPMPDGSVGLVVGDVCGHGLGAAIVMALTCAHLRSLTQTYNEVEEILRRLNRFLTNETDRFTTLLFARLDGRTRSLICNNAGHPAAYVLDASGQVKAQVRSTALPLAILENADFPASDPVALEPGDVVLLLTDGVLEAKSAELEAKSGAEAVFGIERTLEVVRAHCDGRAAEIVAAIHRAVQEFCHPKKVMDDITAIVIKVEM